MKKIVVVTLLSLALFGTGNLRAADVNYGAAYNGSLGGGMMGTMWEFMEWFLGRRNNAFGNNAFTNNPYGRSMGWSPGASNPYRHRDYWDDPSNPWVDMQPLEGTWRAQSGEYWFVRDSRFVLVDNQQQKMTGEFLVEGDFILTRMPWGEVEFEFRQMDDVLILRDVNGRIMLLRRVEAGGWNW